MGTVEELAINSPRRPSWRNRPVFVTGATGLLGSRVVAGLVDSGAEVVCLVRDGVPRSNFHILGLADRVVTVRGELEDGRLLERILNEYEVEVVLHLGAQTIVGASHRSPLSSFESNIRGTWHVLEACRLTPSIKAIVVASSDKAYGEQEVLPYTEEMALQARNPYDVSKAAAEMLTRSYHHAYDLPVGITRCGNLYGGGDLNFSRLVPGTIRSVLLGERPVIRSDGSLVRDYLYVDDAASALLALGESLVNSPALAGTAFNISAEEPATVLEMTSLVLEVMGSELQPDVRDEAHHEIQRQYLSAARAHSLLGWRPAVPTREAVTRTVDWYRDYLQ